MRKSNVTESQKTEIFSAWLEGDLNKEQRLVFEQLCSEDEQFASQVKTANQMTFQAQDYQDVAPEDWAREATFDFVPEKKWWQWQGLPAFSMALSVFAIVLVLSGFQVRVADNALTFSFNQSQPDLDSLVDQKLAEFRANQQQILTAYAQSLQDQQLATSTQLTNYLLTSSRQERKEDFAELIKFINEQRSDDQIYFARQLNQLQQRMYEVPLSENWPADSLQPEFQD